MENSNDTIGNKIILHTTKKMKSNWIGYLLLGNCLLKHVVEEKMNKKLTVRRGRKRKQLLDDFWKREDTGY
jgi:hypothetical protein